MYIRIKQNFFRVARKGVGMVYRCIPPKKKALHFEDHYQTDFYSDRTLNHAQVVPLQIFAGLPVNLMKVNVMY
jgi:hypothetical protein